MMSDLGTKLHRVAVLTIQGRPYHVTLRKMLHHHFQAGIPECFYPSFYTLFSDKESIKAAIRSLIHSGKCDSIIAVGESISLHAKEVVNEMGGFPMLFIGVRDPVKLGLVSSLSYPGGSVTGAIKENEHPLSLAQHLMKLHPVVRKVFIPYMRQSRSLHERVAVIKEYAGSNGLCVVDVPIEEDAAATMKTIEKYSSLVDGILLPEGCYSNILQDAVARLCWEKSIVFFGSGPTAIRSGAACAFGCDINQLAEAAYQQLCSFALNGVPYGMMPVAVLPNDRKFMVNIDMFRRIGFPLEALEQLCREPETEVVREWRVAFPN